MELQREVSSSLHVHNLKKLRIMFKTQNYYSAKSVQAGKNKLCSHETSAWGK